jgi:hypothetical protein
MPIRVNDLKDALEKLNEPQATLDKPGGIMDQLSGNVTSLKATRPRRAHAPDRDPEGNSGFARAKDARTAGCP